MNQVKKFIGRFIHLAKYATGRDRLFHDTHLLQPKPPVGAGKNVLIYTYKWWAHHLAAEAVIGRALELRGARVSFFACDSPKDACDNFRLEDNKYLTCSQCLYSRERFLDETSFDTVTVRQFVKESDAAEIEAAAKSDDIAELKRLSRDGIPLGLPAAASAIRFLRVTSLEEFPTESLPVLKGFVKMAMETYLACDRMFQAKKFDSIVVQSGLSCSESIVIDLAKKYGVPYVTYDFGFILGTMMFRTNASISDTDIRPIWDHYARHELTASENDALNKYLIDRQFGRNSMINQWPNPKFDGQPLNVQEVHARGGRIFTAFTNVAWDTAWSQISSAFPSMFGWLEETIRAFIDRPQDFLVIRIHPAEVRMSRGITRSRADRFIKEKFPALPSNIRVILPEDTLSSYSLIPPADGILVYTSTIGIEAAAMGKPVITGTQVHYSRYGFAREAKSPADYREYLSHWADRVEGRDTETETALARKYAFLYFLKLGVPFKFMDNEGPRLRPRMTLPGPSDLAPGKDVHLDEICDGILNDHPIFVRQ